MKLIPVLLTYSVIFFVFFSRLATADGGGSSANRQGKNVFLGFEPVGMSVSPIPSYGLRAGYYLTDSSVLLAKYVYGKADLLFFESTTKFAEVGWQGFWGNTFYTFFGIGMRDLHVKTRIDLSAAIAGENGTANTTMGITSYGFSAAIGNQWQWENFTLGCDWFGTFTPLVKGAQRDSGFSDDLSEEDRKEKQDKFDDVAENISYQLVRFYIGVSF